VSLEKFREIDQASLEDHGRLGLDLEYASWFRKTYVIEEQQLDEHLEIPSSIEFETILPGTERNRFPLFVVRSSASNTYDLPVDLGKARRIAHPFR